MSIVCYKDGIIASDSLTTYDNGLIKSSPKIMEYYNYLIGAVGQLDSSEYFINKLNNIISNNFNNNVNYPIYHDFYKNTFNNIIQKLNLKEEDHFQIMVVYKYNPNDIYSLSSRGMGIFLLYNMEKDPNKPAYFTMGAASRYAHAALHLGSSAIEACKVATELNIYCGGSINSLSF